MPTPPESVEDDALFKSVLNELFRLPAGARVLDVGCGQGHLVEALRAAGFDAHGTDLARTLGTRPRPPYIVPIEVTTTQNASASYRVVDRYTLPFEDGSFAAVLSSQVLEHVQDKAAFFAEIHRVLRPGGLTAHVYPSRYYLPYEPHIFVPLVPQVWPLVPGAWLSLWAMLGVRNEFQHGLGWREVVRRNADYCRDGLSYWSFPRYRRLLEGTGFRDVRHDFDFQVRHSVGAYARVMRNPAVFGLARRVPILQQLRQILLTAAKAE